MSASNDTPKCFWQANFYLSGHFDRQYFYVFPKSTIVMRCMVLHKMNRLQIYNYRFHNLNSCCRYCSMNGFDFFWKFSFVQWRSKCDNCWWPSLENNWFQMSIMHLYVCIKLDNAPRIEYTGCLIKTAHLWNQPTFRISIIWSSRRRNRKWNELHAWNLQWTKTPIRM